MTDWLFAGIDVGSTFTKAVLVNAKGETSGRATVPTGINFQEAGTRVLSLALEKAHRQPLDIKRIVSTGLGRHHVKERDGAKTEIACHAKGAFFAFGGPLTIIDVGGQDNKIIFSNENGQVDDFKMNRKCAAGTGLFLEEIAHRLDIPLEEMNTLAASAKSEIEIGSFCTVFAAQEVLAAARGGADLPKILRGVYLSMVKRVMEMDSLPGKVIATGGVTAHNPVFCSLLSSAIGKMVEIPPKPQLVGALGAALFGAYS